MERTDKNILAKFCLNGTDEETFKKSIKWVDEHTVYKTVNTEDIRLLSLQSHRKKNGQYEVKFLLIDPYAPYVVVSENMFSFNTKRIRLQPEVMEKVQETGFMFEIEDDYYMVPEETIHSIGTLLDCHGKMLKEPFLGRDLCIAEAIGDLEQLGIIYRENNKKGLKMLVSVFGNRAIYHTLETLVNNCFHMLVNAQELEMHKWSVTNNGADIYMDYSKYGFIMDNGDEWQCGIHICIKCFSGIATQIFWYARKKEKYLYLHAESIKHTTKNLEPIRKQIRAGFFVPFQQFRNTMAKMDGVVDLKRVMNAYELRGCCVVDAIEKNSGLFKATGCRTAFRIKVQMNGKLKAMDQISLYDMFMMFLEYTEKNAGNMNERYMQQAFRAMAVLPESIQKNLTKYLIEKKKDQIAGQMSFDFVMNE